MFENAPELYLVLTPDFRIVAASEAYLRATMTKREDILGRGIFEVFPDNPDDPAASGVRNLRASLERVVQTGQADTMAVQKYDIRRPDSEGGGFEERHWSPVNSPVTGSDGKPRYIIHRVEDVTEFVRLVHAGKEQEKRTEALRVRAEQMEMEVFLRSQQLGEVNRKLTAANAELEKLYNQIALLMAQADDELRVTAADEDRWDFLQNPIAPAEMLSRVGRLIAGYKRLDEQLRQSQKMEAVGRLAGGLAHDFNNMLTVITGFASLAQHELPEGPARHSVGEIQRAAARAATLTGQLLAFSRKQVVQPRTLDLNEVVAGMEGLVGRLIGEDIRLVTILPPALSKVKADTGQIEQVIMNLVVNARDAMPDGGTLTVETKNVRLESGEVRSLDAGPYVRLSVRDTGHGMDPDTASRIFEPFFTTKPVGKGTGLGLATVYGIAEQSGGAVTVSSELGKGATFQVYLPAITAAVTREEPARSEPVPRSGAGTILLVEDEEAVRKLVRTILTSAGYLVVDAANGDQALDLVNRHPGRIDLMLSDIVMPGMSGVELAERLHSTRPDLLVLYMSGYDRELISRKKIGKTARFLPKPFTPQALLSQVGAMLGKPDERRPVSS